MNATAELAAGEDLALLLHSHVKIRTFNNLCERFFSKAEEGKGAMGPPPPPQSLAKRVKLYLITFSTYTILNTQCNILKTSLYQKTSFICRHHNNMSRILKIKRMFWHYTKDIATIFSNQ